MLAQSRDVLTAEQVQVGFIYNFTKYTEWRSDDPRENDPSHFHICVVGDGAVAQQLDVAIQGKMVNSRTIAVRHLGDDTNLDGCELLYVGNLSRRVEDRVAAVLGNRPTLTIGSTPGFLRDEGMVTFVVEDKRVRFDINARVAERANIRFDSRILVLARKVTGSSR